MFCGGFFLQINEFSVEPPAFYMEDDEEEYTLSPSQSHPIMETSQMDMPPHAGRPLSNKSHSLPYKSYPFQPAITFSSDEDCYSGPSDDSSDSEKGEYEDMFFKSLPECQFSTWAVPPIIILDSDSNVDSQNKNQSELLNQTHAVSKDIQDCPPASESADMEMIANNADDQCLIEAYLSPLPSETEHLNVKRKEDEDRSAENDGEDQSDSEKPGNVNEPIQEENKKMESTDSKDETLTCR